MVAVKQYEYAGLTLGDGNFPLTLVEGLDMPDSREDSTQKGSDHGAWTWAQFVEARRVIFTGHIEEDTDSEFAARVQSLRLAFAPQSSYRALSFHFPGEGDRRVHCVPTKRHFPYTTDAALSRYMEWMVELVAEDPRIYSETEYEVSPVTTNVLANAGSVPSPPVIEILGPATDPVLRNDTDDIEIVMDGSIPAGDVWTFDLLQHTIRDQDDISHYGKMDQAASEWWMLLPGNNSVVVTGGGTATVRWRDAWL